MNDNCSIRYICISGSIQGTWWCTIMQKYVSKNSIKIQNQFVKSEPICIYVSGKMYFCIKSRKSLAYFYERFMLHNIRFIMHL